MGGRLFFVFVCRSGFFFFYVWSGFEEWYFGVGRDGYFGGFGDGVRIGCVRLIIFLRGKILNEVYKNLLMVGMEINFFS